MHDICGVPWFLHTFDGWFMLIRSISGEGFLSLADIVCQVIQSKHFGRWRSQFIHLGSLPPQKGHSSKCQVGSFSLVSLFLARSLYSISDGSWFQAWLTPVDPATGVHEGFIKKGHFWGDCFFLFVFYFFCFLVVERKGREGWKEGTKMLYR